jgi:hypothetical protein
MHKPERPAIERPAHLALLLPLLAGLIAAIVLVPSAQARPRDDVMSGAFRCAPISDSRKWLDCYYGAAQPARAALGLQPAPDAQVRLVLSPVSDGSLPVDVAVRDAVMSGAFRCNASGSDRQWLDCYYASAQPMRVILGLQPVPQAGMAMAPAQIGVVPAPSETRPAPPANGFGLAPPPKFKDDPDRVTSRMAAYTFDKHGIFTVTLVNGQVWQQVAGDTTIAHWKRPAENYVVRISHGFLGSYNFQVTKEPGLFKVLRVS